MTEARTLPPPPPNPPPPHAKPLRPLPFEAQHCSGRAARIISNCKQDVQHTASMRALLQGPDMTNPCCKVWLDGAKATPAEDRPDRPPGCNLVSALSLLLLWSCLHPTDSVSAYTLVCSAHPWQHDALRMTLCAAPKQQCGERVHQKLISIQSHAIQWVAMYMLYTCSLTCLLVKVRFQLDVSGRSVKSSS